MERQLERCCGLDVHKETVAACVRIGGRSGKAEQHVQTFGTTVGELLVLRDWLGAPRVTHVAMESNGVYWRTGCYTRGDGEHRRVLEASVLHAGERLHLFARKCRAYQAGSWAEDRRQGLRLDRATPRAWAAAGQLRAASADSRPARPDPLSESLDPRSDPGGQSPAQGP